MSYCWPRTTLRRTSGPEAIAFQDTVAALVHGQNSPAYRKLAPRASYGDFVSEQQEFVSGPEGQSMLEAWQQHLQDCNPRIELPTDAARTDIAQYEGSSVGYTLSAQIAAAVRETARTLRVTPFVLMYGTWQLLLSRICNQELISQATPTLGRPKRFLRTAGCFSNPAVLRVNVAEARSFEDLLVQVQEELAFTNSNSRIPFELVVECAGFEPQQPCAAIQAGWLQLSSFVCEQGNRRHPEPVAR